MPPSAVERLNRKKEPKKVLLDYDFAGVKKGQWLFVGTPQIIADYICKIPYGETRTIDRLRRELARRRKCDATCPVSTAIFIRIAAEAAIEEMAAGKPTEDVIPFWRLLSADDKITKRLDIDPDWLDHQRALEAQK